MQINKMSRSNVIKFAQFFLMLFLMQISIISVGFEKELPDPETLKEYAPNLYIDSRTGIDMNFIKTEIEFVNYVTELKGTDIHLFITIETTSSGGRDYTLRFIGKNEYDGVDNTLKYFSKVSESEDQIRRGLVRVIKQGLMPFLYNNPVSDHIDISYQKKDRVREIKDKWNNWVFRLSFSSYLNGQEKTKNRFLYSTFSISHITLKNKFRLFAAYNQNRDYYDMGEYGIIKGFSESKSINFLYAYSIDDHWTFGLSNTGFGASTYNNQKLYLSLVPSIEYNIFPYSASSTKEFKIRYMIGLKYNDYIEETLFDKTQEFFMQGTLMLSLTIKTTWGSVYNSISGSHYFHDLSKNNLKVFSSLSLNLFKGFSVNINGFYIHIRDQISLPKGDATEDQILLRRRALATKYDYYISVGISYTFGSIYSNIVNTRFD